MKEIFSSGGGTQSTAIAALIYQAKLYKPDMIVIVDTGRECSETWQYLETVINTALKKIGLEVIRIDPGWASIPKHGKNYLSHNGKTLLIGAWTNQNGQVGKLSSFCSKSWKVHARDRYLSKKFRITQSKRVMWIGFSADEWRRAQRIMVSDEGKKGLIMLPLIQKVMMTRWEAIREVENLGWPTPPRSRCWMCPNQADDEWRDLKLNHPDEFQKAIDFEKEMQEYDPFAWLHKSCIPLGKVDFSKDPTLFDSGLYCNSGVCFV